MSNCHGLMEKSLIMAVPMWVQEHQDKSIDWLMKRKDNIKVPKEYLGKHAMNQVRSIASLIGERGDALQYGSKKPGEVGFLFNCLAEGLAILAICCDGGVNFGDLHFEYPHKDLKKESIP